MTTGPSSGHSESWYWLQSSHPATDVRVSEGTECWEGPPHSAPHKYENGANTGWGPQGKDLPLQHTSKYAVTLQSTQRTRSPQGGRINENSPI